MPATPAETLAQQLMASLGEDLDFTLPDLDGEDFALPDRTDNPLYGAITSLTVADLTTGLVGGSGAFDVLMSSHRAHLKDQRDKGLISGDQYTKAYIELTTAALTSAVQYLLGKDQAHWAAVLAQAQGRRAEIEAVTAAVGLATAKAQLLAAQNQNNVLEAQHVLIQLQAAVESAKFDLTQQQLKLVTEQTEAQRAQTLDTRSDGTTPVAGLTGKQKDLYTQQITSYQRDSEQKVAKMFLDSWITQKTLDEGLTAPNELTNATIQTVMGKLRTNVSLTE